VAKLDTIRVLFSIAANLDWPLHQFDVKNAFLHGELQEEVYMEAPPGFTSEFSNREGCRLKKALYGLKQSPRAWFGRFTSAMRRFGYRQSHSDHTLFLRKRGGKITCLIIYVDDMIITGDDKVEIENLKRKLFQEFEMKDLGRLKYFLGIEVLRSNKGIFISQRKYVLDLLAETGMMDCKPIETPMMMNHGLQILEGAEFADRMQYQRLVGKLIYLAHTRPDIAYAVGVVSRFMHKPRVQHMEAVLRIPRYLKGTSGRGVLYQKHGHLDLTAYTDADWAGDRDDRKSTSGYFTLVGGNLVT
jgi:reverse transcriptase-like protein